MASARRGRLRRWLNGPRSGIVFASVALAELAYCCMGLAQGTGQGYVRGVVFGGMAASFGAQAYLRRSAESRRKHFGVDS